MRVSNDHHPDPRDHAPDSRGHNYHDGLPCLGATPRGWTKYTGGGAEIYLPPEFDLNLLDATARESFAALGPVQANTVKGLEAIGFSQYSIFVADSASVASGWLTNVAVEQEKTDVNATLKEYVDATVSQLSSEMSNAGFRVAERTDLRLNGREATQLVCEVSLQVPASELMYVVKGPPGFWGVAYVTTAADFPARFPGFDKSAATFNIGP